MLDESLLDAPEALAEADRRGLLRGAAEAGARVRTAARHAAEAGIPELKPDGRPRAVLIAGPGAAAISAADLLGTLAGAGCPVIRLAPTGVAPAAGALRWELPGWAGSVDLLLIATPDGSEPGLSLLVEQAYRRGCTVAAVAPARSPLTDAVDGAHGLFVQMATAPYEPEAPSAASAPGVLWALLTPLLALLDRTGLVTAPPEALQKVADRLDQIAERCGPAIATYSNPAKTLAAELAEALPVIWTEGTSAGPAGRRFVGALAELAGRPALAAELPEALCRAQRPALGRTGRRRGPGRLLPRPRRGRAGHARARGPPPRPPDRRPQRRPRRPRTGPQPRHTDQRTRTGGRRRPGDPRRADRHHGFRRRLPGARLGSLTLSHAW